MWWRLMLQCGMNLTDNELSRSGKETMVRRLEHEGLRQLQTKVWRYKLTCIYTATCDVIKQVF